LAEHVDQVELVHPKKVKAIASAKIKTDKIDAATLAHLARADLLPTAYAPPPHIRQGRALVRHRAKMVRDRARAKNRVHGHLAQKGIRSPVSDLFGKKGRAFLDEVASQLDAVSQAILADHLAIVEALSRCIEVSEEQIIHFIEAHPELKANVALLSTILLPLDMMHAGCAPTHDGT
jgi:transposase